MYGVLVQPDFCYTLRKEIEKGNLFLRKPFAHGLKPLLYIPMEKKKRKVLNHKNTPSINWYGWQLFKNPKECHKIHEPGPLLACINVIL